MPEYWNLNQWKIISVLLGMQNGACKNNSLLIFFCLTLHFHIDGL